MNRSLLNRILTWRNSSRFLVPLLVFLFALNIPALGQTSSDGIDSFDLAQKLFEDASYSNAAEELRRFIINYPSSDRIAAAMYRLAEALFFSARFDEAGAAFRGFADRYPKHIDVSKAMRLAAESHQRLGDNSGAGLAFLEVHDTFMSGEYAAQDLLRAGYNFHLAAELDEAESAFRKLIEKYPDSPLIHEATYNLGELLRDAGRPEEAVAQFARLTETETASERQPDGLLALAEIALEAGRGELAESIIGRLRKTHSGTLAAETSYIMLAEWFKSQGDLGRAIQNYEAALVSLPANEPRQKAELGLAEAYRTRGEHQRSLEACSRFLKGYPESPLAPEARLALGRAYAGLGEFRAAVQAYQRVIESYPESASSALAHLEIGDIWQQLGDSRKALTAYGAFADRSKDPEQLAIARLKSGRLYEALGWTDKAEAVYRELLEKGEHFAGEAQFRLARAYEASSRPSVALREYQLYIKSYSSESHAEEAERRILYLQEFPPSALHSKAVLKMIAGLPILGKDPAGHLAVARTMFENGLDSAAAAELEIIVEKDSTHLPEAAFLIGEVWRRQSRKLELAGRPDHSASAMDRAEAGYRTLLERFPKSTWHDDASLALTQIELAKVSPDTLRVRRALTAYGEFKEHYADSDRMDIVDLRTAEALLVRGKSDTAAAREALELYRSFPQRHPDSERHEQAAFGEGLSLALLKDYAEAEEIFQDFLFDYPGSRLSDRAGFELGRILLGRAFHASAAEVFSQLLEAPGSLELERRSRILLAECYFQMDEYDRSIQLDIRSLRQRPDPYVFHRLAESYRKLNAFDNAVRTFADYLRIFPDAADADSVAFERARLLTSTERVPEAMSALQGFLKSYPGSNKVSDVLGTLGDLYFDSEAYTDAINAYQKIPAVHRRPPISGRIALCYYRQGKEKEGGAAAKSFRKVHGDDPGWQARFKVEEGRLNLEAGRSDKARKQFREVIQKYANTQAVGDARYFLIRSLDKQGKAEEHFETLIGFVSGHPESPYWSRASFELAELYDGNEDYLLAAKVYNRVLENGLPPEKRPEVYTRLVRDYRNLKLHDSAIAVATRLVEEHPRHPLALDARMEIGDMLHEKGAHAQAVRELTPLLKSTERDDWSSVQYTIAESYLDLGEIDSALREFLKLRYNFKGSVNWLANAHLGLSECYAARGELGKAIDELNEIKRRFGATSHFSVFADEKISDLRGRLIER